MVSEPRDRAAALPDGALVFPTMAPSVLGGPAEVALSRTADGDLVAVGFTDLDGLVAAFGPQQPWLAFDRHDIALLLEGSGVTRVLIDATITNRAGEHPSE